MKIDFGYSPCPNDTFMFWGWVHGKLETSLTVAPELLDIQELNRRALGAENLPFTKVSVATYLQPAVRERYRLLTTGAALGRGCGPLVVSARPWSLQEPRLLKLAVPGRDTTACRLARMALGEWVSEWVEMRYDEIMPAVLEGSRVDAGVIIHESRFAYQKLGLACAFDLGEWWEKETGLPLPLGLMLAHRDVEEKITGQVEEVLRQSILLARTVMAAGPTHPEARSLWTYLRANAIELEDQTIASHIDLYVNDFSVDLGEEGRAAMEAFERLVEDLPAES
ncbi:MAG: 1,4-dihydroxy-6-naphthoate synthase [Vulcanimicrobiota bacterium]